MATSNTYTRKTIKERQKLFSDLSRRLGHDIINIAPPKDKDKIKEARKISRLSGAEAATVCGVSRRSWTMWENAQNLKNHEGKKVKESYPSDWQWGWFLLATNQHPTLQLVRKINGDQ